MSHEGPALDPTRTPHLTPRSPAVITYYNPLDKIVEHYEAELAKSQTLCDELKRRSEESGEEKIKVWARFSRTLRMSKSFFKMSHCDRILFFQKRFSGMFTKNPN